MASVSSGLIRVAVVAVAAGRIARGLPVLLPSRARGPAPETEAGSGVGRWVGVHQPPEAPCARSSRGPPRLGPVRPTTGGGYVQAAER